MGIQDWAWFECHRGLYELQQRFWINSESIAGLRRFPAMLWLLLFMHTMHSFGSFAISVNFALILRRVFSIHNDATVSYYYTIWKVCSHIFECVLGFVVELIGYWRAVVIGSFLLTVGRLLFTFSSYLWLSLASLFWLISAGSVLFEQATDLLPLYYFKSDSMKTIVFAIFYASMNLGALLSLIVTYFSLEYTEGWRGYRLLMTVVSCTSAAACLCSWYYQNPPLLEELRGSAPPTADKGTQSNVQRLKQQTPKLKQIFTVLTEAGLWRMMLLRFSMTGVYTIYRLMDLTLIVYLVRVDPNSPYALLLAINTVLIIPLVSISGVMTSRSLTNYIWMMIGTLTAATAVLWLWIIPGNPTPAVICFMLQVTVGESIFAPKAKQWFADKAPEGRKAIYQGWLSLAQVPGEFASASLASWLLQTYCPEITTTFISETGWEDFVSRAHLLWLWVAAAGMTTFLLLGIFYPLLNSPPKILQLAEGVELVSLVSESTTKVEDA